MPEKKTLRSQLLSERKSLTELEINTLSTRILAYFKTIELNKLKVIHLFLPIVSKNEPNTFLLIDYLKTHFPSIKIVIPKTDFKHLTMQSFEFDEKLLELNNYGISEPKSDALIFDGMIDLILMPLLAFDAKGYRLGYGKGFYDRFIHEYKSPLLKIGLCFQDKPLEISDLNEYDVPMDACITPNGIIKF